MLILGLYNYLWTASLASIQDTDVLVLPQRAAGQWPSKARAKAFSRTISGYGQNPKKLLFFWTSPTQPTSKQVLVIFYILYMKGSQRSSQYLVFARAGEVYKVSPRKLQEAGTHVIHGVTFPLNTPVTPPPMDFYHAAPPPLRHVT
jgi:hypothetical protein